MIAPAIERAPRMLLVIGKDEQGLPTETIIVDAVDAHLVTKISYQDFRAEDVKDAWFQRDSLPRFSEE